MGISLIWRKGNLFERKEEGEGSSRKELLIDEPSWQKNRKKKKETTAPLEGIADLKEEERPKWKGIRLPTALLVVLLLKASIQYIYLPSSCGGLKPCCLGAICYHLLLKVTQTSYSQQSRAERIAMDIPLLFGRRAPWVWRPMVISLSWAAWLLTKAEGVHAYSNESKSGSRTWSMKQTGSMHSL